MRHIVRIGCAVALGLSLVPDDALGGWYYPRGYGGYGWGGWGTGMGTGAGMTDPAAGYMAGLGSFARGQGVYEVENAKAQAINLQTMIKWNQELRTRQRELQQRKAREDAQRVAERDVRVARMELEDGTTLNRLLMQVLDFDPAAVKSSQAGAPIGSSAVKEIPFQWNTEAITICLDQLTAQDALPEPLGGDAFREERTAMAQAVSAALQEDARGDVSPATSKRLNAAIAAFRARFVQRVQPSDPDYNDGATYFSTMASLSRLLNDPSMKRVLAELESERETTVGRLIAFMNAFNLRFGPATTARQVEIYQTLTTLLQKVANDLSSTPPPRTPPPPEPGVAGKNLQGAAREAFGNMNWPQIEAHGREQ